MKRFYKVVDTAADAAAGHAVRVDGKPVRTPARNVLAVPTAALASAVAGEWDAQGEQLAPATMPLTRLVTTTLDLMPARRADAVAEAVAYAGTDLLCYRASDPDTLTARQRAAWQPWLDWAERHLDARLVVTHGIDPVPQPEAALDTLRRTVERLDDWRLVGLHATATLTGSLILALAVERGALGAGDAFEAALLDDLYEIERWGEETTQQERHASLRRDLGAATTYLRLLEA